MFPQLVAESAHVNLDDVRHDLDGVPHLLDELGLRHRLARPTRQVREEIELALRELEQLPAGKGIATPDVEVEGTGVEHQHSRCATRQRSEPGEELIHRERLRQVVVRAEVQRPHTVLDLTPGRQHQDRTVEVGSTEMLADLQAVSVRQHPVDDREVELLAEGRLRFRDRGPKRHLVAARGEDAHEQRPELPIILHEQNMHGPHSRRACCDRSQPYTAVRFGPSPTQLGLRDANVALVTPQPSPPPSSGPEPRFGQSKRPQLRYAALGLIVLAVVGGGAVAWSRIHRGSTTAPPVVTRDVPRVEGSAVVFSPAFRERAGLAFAKVELAPFKPTVRVVGTVAFNPSFVAAVGTRVRGTVRRTFKYEGDRVAAGDALAEIESAELGEAQATVVQAEAASQAAEIQARRERELLDKGLTTAREAEVAQTELATHRAALQAAQQRARAFGGGGGFGVYVLRSPLAGHVVERHVAPGQSVDGSSAGYKIADLAHLWIELSVFERDLPAVRVGDEVDVSPLSTAGVKLPGKVAHVGEVIDPVSRSTQVRIAVDNPKVHLRPGQAVEATITSASVEREALLVPHASVVYVDGKATVFVAESDTRVRAAAVRLGASDGSRHEVVEGLKAGDQVASAGVFTLKSELYR